MHSKLESLKETVEYAEEKLVAATQSILEDILREKGMSKTDLAKRMGVSKSRVSQIFSDNQNFTFRLVANAFHALGEEMCVSRVSGKVEHKSLESVSEDCVSLDDKFREISHGFEWIDREIEIGGQPVRESALSKKDVADLLKEALQAVIIQSGETLHSRHSRERDHDKATVSDWSQAGDASNVIPMFQRKAAVNG